MEVRLECNEPGCKNEAESAYCERHLDAMRDEAFADGKKEGFDEGYHKAKEELEPHE